MTGVDMRMISEGALYDKFVCFKEKFRINVEFFLICAYAT